jgi:hypothetical protein
MRSVSMVYNHVFVWICADIDLCIHVLGSVHAGPYSFTYTNSYTIYTILIAVFLDECNVYMEDRGPYSFTCINSYAILIGIFLDLHGCDVCMDGL